MSGTGCAENTSTSKAAILIAAYNAETTIERATRSALAQEGVAEVCVVDDGSTDGTAERARCADDSRLHIIRLPHNQGPSAARNRAIEATQSPWIAVLDADDYLQPGRISKLLAQAGDVDFIADELIRVHSATGETEKPGYWCTDGAPRMVDLCAFLLANLGDTARFGLDMGFAKPLIRRDFLAQHSLKYDSALRLGEDYELYARALALGARFLAVPAAGYVSVERQGSLSTRHSSLDLQRLRDCDDAIAALRPLRGPERAALRRHSQSVDKRLQWRLLIDAVKAKDAGGLVSPFQRSPSVSTYLVMRLIEQLYQRSARLIRASA